MATYYKYAERSAESQINWAEVGKNMSDMLKEETRIREEKKSAIDAASREFGNTLANPPQGEHKGANQWALEYGDNASQFMLMQDRLLKSGQMKLKDYTIARQNILDGTDRAFNLSKDYQAVFADKMERYKTDKSQDLEQWLMGQAEGYSDFNKSQLYINPIDGTVSVAMKELKKIDGKDVYVMNTNPNEFTSINTLKNQIAGKYDKYDTNTVTSAFVKGLGEETTSAISKAASLSSGGLILTVEDIRNRKDIDPKTKEILYQFSDSENQFIKGSLVNPYDRLSVLTNSQKFAPNKLQYTFTNDAADAKANPNKILLKVDPSSGQQTPDFSDEQIKVSEDFMRTELRAKYKSTEELKTTPQVELQERRSKTIVEAEAEKEQSEAKILAKQIANVTTGDAKSVQSALDFFDSITGKKSTKTGDILTVVSTDDKGASVTNTYKLEGNISDVGAKLGRAYNVNNLNEEILNKNINQFTKGKTLNTTTFATGGKTVKQKALNPIEQYNKTLTDDVINMVKPLGKLVKSSDVKKAVNGSAFASKYGIKVDNTYMGNSIYIPKQDGRPESPEFPVGTRVKNINALKALEAWMKKNYLKGTTLEEKETEAELINKTTSGVSTVQGELD